MRWDETIKLIKSIPGGTDSQGFPEPDTEISHTAFAGRASVGQSEFYKSAQAGMTAELKLTVRSVDFGSETVVETADGKRYKVLRTYVTKQGEFTELTLSDLSKRSENTS
jgi:hypothetical protein